MFHRGIIHKQNTSKQITLSIYKIIIERDGSYGFFRNFMDFIAYYYFNMYSITLISYVYYFSLTFEPALVIQVIGHQWFCHMNTL